MQRCSATLAVDLLAPLGGPAGARRCYCPGVISPALPAIACGVAMAPLLAAERVESLAGKWIAKPIASLAFVAVGLTAGAADTRYGAAILTGLVLALIGDVLLIAGGAGLSFLLGLGSFLLGHVAYAVAFVIRGVAPLPAISAAVVLVAILVPVARWLLPHAGKLRGPVIAYMIVITAMVALAAGTVAGHGHPVIAAGAIAFYLSDLSVARDRFVAPGFDNRAWGLPLYYGAQVLLAWSVAGA